MGLNHYLIKKWKEFSLLFTKYFTNQGMEADCVTELMLELAIMKIWSRTWVGWFKFTFENPNFENFTFENFTLENLNFKDFTFENPNFENFTFENFSFENFTFENIKILN